jgi:hypothetical protein
MECPPIVSLRMTGEKSFAATPSFAKAHPRAKEPWLLTAVAALRVIFGCVRG